MSTWKTPSTKPKLTMSITRKAPAAPKVASAAKSVTSPTAAASVKPIAAKPVKSTARDASDYGKRDQRTNIYKNPDSFVGSPKQIEREVTVADLNDPDNIAIVKIETTVPRAIEKIFLEIAVNASDNVSESRDIGIDPEYIIVNVDRTTVRIRNKGQTIPIKFIRVKTDDGTGHGIIEDMWAAELILGNLNSSSNYGEKKKIGAGKNGFGAKLGNIFSKRFSVEIGNKETGKHYYQLWENNMLVRHDPIITEDYDGENFTEVEYVLDFARFGYDPEIGYDDDAINLFAYHCLNFAFSQNIPVFFNEVELKTRDLLSYAKCMFGREIKPLTYKQYPVGTELKTVLKGPNKGKTINKPVDKNAEPCFTIHIFDTPNESQIFAFTNGLINPDGGVHVKAAYEAIKNDILNIVNNPGRKTTATTKGKAGAKGKAGTKAKPKDKDTGPKLTLADLKKHVSMIILYKTGEEQTYNNQYKERLDGPAPPPIKIDPEWFGPIKNWDLIRYLEREMLIKMDNLLGKTDAKRGEITKGRGSSANFAKSGSTLEKRRQTTMVLTEGDSAKSFAEEYFAALYKNFRDTYGFIPLKGKVLNVRDKSITKIAKNNEIAEIKQRMGLREGVDYTLQENIDTLKHHKLMIIADPDVDGSHILGLIINYLDCHFPGLLKSCMVDFSEVTLLRVTNLKTKEVLMFYNKAQVKEWENQTPNHTNDKIWFYKYYKGLATFEPEEARDDALNGNVRSINIEYDEDASYNTDIMFNKKHADLRKKLIEDYVPDDDPTVYEAESISHLMQNRVAEYGLANVQRSIPQFSGLKDVHNKIIFAIFKTWRAGDEKQMKVFNFACKAMELTEYEHGPESMAKTIVTMAQNYVGANNLPLMAPRGMFGTRTGRSKDGKIGADHGAFRYIGTHPSKLLWSLILADDLKYAVRRVEEGQELEYINIDMLLPYALINGAEGMGTGWSTYIPSCNPLDLIKYYILTLNGKAANNVEPWYRGFTGECGVVERSRPTKKRAGEETVEEELVDDDLNLTAASSSTAAPSKKDKLDEDVELYDDEDHDHADVEPENQDDKGTRFRSGNKPLSMITRGKYAVVNNKVIVTELPVGMSTRSYEIWLNTLIDKKVIKKYDDNGTPAQPKFTIIGLENPSIKRLRLERSKGLSNMVLLNAEGKPKYYSSIKDILDTFLHFRLIGYEKRKAVIIAEKEQAIIRLGYKVKFLQEVVIVKSFDMRNITKEELTFHLDRIGVPSDIPNSIGITQQTKNKMEKLMKEMAKIQADLDDYINKPIQEIWQEEMLHFVKEYAKVYPEDMYRLNEPGLIGTIFESFHTKAIALCKKMPGRGTNVNELKIKGAAKKVLPAVQLKIRPARITLRKPVVQVEEESDEEEEEEGYESEVAVSEEEYSGEYEEEE